MTVVPGPETSIDEIDFISIDFNREVALITGIEYYRDIMFLDFVRYFWNKDNTVDHARLMWNAKGQISNEDDYGCGKCWTIIYDIVLEYASGKITCSSPANFYQELIAPKIEHPNRFENWFSNRIGGNPSQLFFTNKAAQEEEEEEEVPHIPYAAIKKPLWQRARKDFIRLVDDDKIPEEHKRLNLHYLRTLPYEAISTAKPIIVEAPEPEPEPDVMLYPAGQSFSRSVYVGGRNNCQYVTKTISKPLYRKEAQQVVIQASGGDLRGVDLNNDNQLKEIFINWLFFQGSSW